MTTRSFEVRPIDIHQIRQGLILTLEKMGRLIAIHSRGEDNETYVPSRISEWEKGHRSVPGYVYRAVAYVLLDRWSDDRHAVARDKVADVDVFYGSMLAVPYAELLRLEHALGNSRKAADRIMLTEVRRARRAQQRYLEQLLDVTMGYVFATEPGGYDMDVAGEVL